MPSTIYISSEIADLKRVLVHRPDNGIARVSPKMAEVLLFDDIVHVPTMKKEHDIFTDVLRAFLGDEGVLEMHDLVIQALDIDKKERDAFLKRIVDFEELPDTYFDILQSLENDDLARVLISGYYATDDLYMFHPIPNFIFTRDLAVTLKDHILVTKAAKEARERENLLARLIIWEHPIFKELRDNHRIINMNNVNLFPPSRKGQQIYLEGGDVMVINDDYLLIGHSERTSEFAIESLMKVLFDKKLFSNVVQVNIPSERSFMHLDTLFTQVDEDVVICHKPIVFDGKNSNVVVHRSSGEERTYNSIKEFFLQEINDKMTFVFGGRGETPYQEREQWTDACNLVVVQPGVALSYDRNSITEIAFKEAGFKVMKAEDFLKAVSEGKLNPSELKRTIISIPSGELSRARGGSHCMTCPIERGK